MSKKSSGWSRNEKATVGTIIGVTVVWAIVVGLSGANIDLIGVPWKFERTAQLGDSFGVVGGIMATLAAAFTFITLREERAEVRRLREREDERDKSDAERDKSDKRRESETTFFQLINLRNSILDNIAIERDPGSHRPTTSGQPALRYFRMQLFGKSLDTVEKQKEHYDHNWHNYEYRLGHYLRFTYHIIRFVDESFDSEITKYDYVRLLRAQLSNSELIIIALNCAHGDGKPKMKEYVEKYALLHSLPNETVLEMHLKDQFEREAFDTARWEALRKQGAATTPTLSLDPPTPAPIASGPL